MKSRMIHVLFAALALASAPAIVFALGGHDRKDSKKPQVATISATLKTTQKAYTVDVAGEPVAFIGTVTLYGSEPHSWTGVTPEKSNDVYRIAQADAALDLQDVQEYRIQFTGVLQKPSAGRLPGSGDSDFFVSSWKILK